MANENKKNNLKEVNLNRYETDVDGVSMKKLEAGLWWSKNRKKLKNILAIILALIGIPLMAYALYGFGDYLLFGMNADDQMMKAFDRTTVVSQSFLNQRSAKNIVISATGYLADGGNYDLYTQATNPNSRWWATFNYCFKKNNGEQSCGSSFILPSQTKYVFSLAKYFNSAPNNLSFSISNLQWKKIDNHLIADWNQYQANRLNMSFSNQQFTPAAANTVSEKVPLNSLTFSISNNSAYSYYEVPLDIVLTDNGRIVYVDQYSASNLLSNQSQNVKITWPGDFESVTGISIAPDINILNQEIYQQPK
jgi:hypothetical protein